ncbi:MAG: hypothetical protein ABI947_15470 [Chloroflexota bacterium]
MPLQEWAFTKYGMMFIEATPDQRLNDALIALAAINGSLEDAMLVVRDGPTEYRTALFNDLSEFVEFTGSEGLNSPLSTVPLRSADRVLPLQTPESSSEVAQALADLPHGVFIVMQDAAIYGVLYNPSLGDPSHNLSLLGTFFKAIKLHDDPFLTPEAIDGQVKRYYCLICHEVAIRKYDVKQAKYVCRQCGHEIKE